MKIDNHDFNEAYFSKMTEDEFIKDQLGSVQDYYGDEDGKRAFLKSAYAKLKPRAISDEKPKVKGK